MSKLSELASIEGMDEMEMFEAATYDSVAAGICTNKDCSYTTQVEPDCEHGWCEECNTQTVSSCLILAGMI